jgi:hypothetical protein
LLELTPELEPLPPLILLQHEGFTQHIKELSHINLRLTKILEKKNDSYDKPKNNKKIPRSLCIKCELTTSPSLSCNNDSLKLKEYLKIEVSNFIQQSTEIMKD